MKTPLKNKNPQRYLKRHEAIILGLEPKPDERGRNNARYRVSNEEYDIIKNNRIQLKDRKFVETIVKKDKEGNTISSTEKLQSEPIESPDNFEIVRISTSKTTGQQWVITQPKKEDKEIKDIDIEKLKNILKKEVKRIYKPVKHKTESKTEGVLKWADLHFGAHIRNLLLTEDYDQDILYKGLMESVRFQNKQGFSKNHVHIHGDLIESFSGLNHINSWQSMDKDAIGGSLIKMCSKMLHNVLSKIDNLGCVKIVAGNHDRISKDNKEDVKGGAAEIIAFCLELMGYDVEFHPYIITHHVQGINYIILHGDKGISSKSTEKIILEYGKQGEYNLICEAHLHSLIEKLSVKKRENFKIVKDDALTYRRFTLPPFFKGNYYSETLGFTTNSGYFSIWANEDKKPQFFNGSY